MVASRRLLGAEGVAEEVMVVEDVERLSHLDPPRLRGGGVQVERVAP